MKQIFLLCLIVLIFDQINCDKKPNKYSADANKKTKSSETFKNYEKFEIDFRNIQRPYRMAKLNLVWTKAQHRLTEPKLASLYTELKIHDKEELAWKQLSSQHKDKDGLKEADLRKKLIGIMSTYGLLEHFDDTQDPEKYKHLKGYEGSVDSFKNKSLFKDKKLNRLWEKAEMAGFTPEELRALKEEFEHHQEKIDFYFNLLENVDEAATKKDNQHENSVIEDEHINFNEIAHAEENDNLESNNIKESKHIIYKNKANELRDSHRKIRDNYDRLERITAKGPNSKDFIEPKVQGLWRIALASDFTTDELDSLKIELMHYESRLLKLRQMHIDYAIGTEKHKPSHNDKNHDKIAELKEHIKKQTRKVEKLHADLEKRVFKHTEL